MGRKGTLPQEPQVSQLGVPFFQEGLAVGPHPGFHLPRMWIAWRSLWDLGARGSGIRGLASRAGGERAVVGWARKGARSLCPPRPAPSLRSPKAASDPTSSCRRCCSAVLVRRLSASLCLPCRSPAVLGVLDRLLRVVLLVWILYSAHELQRLQGYLAVGHHGPVDGCQDPALGRPCLTPARASSQPASPGPAPKSPGQAPRSREQPPFADDFPELRPA